MANMVEKYAADREAGQRKIEQTVSTDMMSVEEEIAHDAFAFTHGERQEGFEDDGFAA